MSWDVSHSIDEVDETDSLLKPSRRRPRSCRQYFTRPLLLSRTLPVIVGLLGAAVVAYMVYFLINHPVCHGASMGYRCLDCQAGYFVNTSVEVGQEGRCKACVCQIDGTVSQVCDQTTGSCLCKANVEGEQCNNCTTGYWNLSSANPLGCQECDCNQAGSVASSVGQCNKFTGNCTCKANVYGLKCDTCIPSYWNLDPANPYGCQTCACEPLFSTSKVCDPTSGQCSCVSEFTGRACTECLQENHYINVTARKCVPCDCRLFTSQLEKCQTFTGQCPCTAQSNTGGRQCDQCLPAFWGLSGFGCKPCNCFTNNTVMNSVVCNVTSGQCVCDPGFTGLECNIPINFLKTD